MSVDPPLEIVRATVADLPEALPVVHGFYQHFGFAWEPHRKRAILAELLASPKVGQLWLLRKGRQAVGYALVVFYLSLEFDGWIAVLDEFYVVPEQRGGGLGARFLTEVGRGLNAGGIQVLRLEVDDAHAEAASLYQRLGFRREARALWSRRLA